MQIDGSTALSSNYKISQMSIYEEFESNVRSYCRDFSKQLVTAQGEYVYDEDGRRYLDFLMGSGSLNYGHNDPTMREALIEYLHADGLALGLDFHFRAKAEFIQALADNVLRPRKLDYKVQFTGPTGTNAVEAAIKLARKVTGKPNVIAFTNAFHGCSLGSLAITGSARIRMSSESQLSHVHRFPYDGYLGETFDSAFILERMLDDPSSGITQVAAIVLEVIQGEGGFNVASKTWAQAVEGIARRHKLLLIVDEIQSGCGRSGDFFAFESLGISPDIIVVAKSISGFGLPMALNLIKPAIDVWEPAEHSGTFRGNGLAFVTAKVALDKFWSDGNFAASSRMRSTDFEHKLDELSEEFGLNRKGRGFMQALKFDDPLVTQAVKSKCFDAGLIIENCGPKGQVLKLLPPLTISEESLSEGLFLLRDTIESVFFSRIPMSSHC